MNACLLQLHCAARDTLHNCDVLARLPCSKTSNELWVQGVDHVILVAGTAKGLLFRQYAIRLKKSGGLVSC